MWINWFDFFSSFFFNVWSLWVILSKNKLVNKGGQYHWHIFGTTLSIDSIFSDLFCKWYYHYFSCHSVSCKNDWYTSNCELTQMNAHFCLLFEWEWTILTFIQSWELDGYIILWICAFYANGDIYVWLIAALPMLVGPCSFELCLCMFCMPLCKLWISVFVTTQLPHVCTQERGKLFICTYVCIYIHVCFCVGLLQSEASSCSELELFCWCSCVCLFVHLCAYMFGLCSQDWEFRYLCVCFFMVGLRHSLTDFSQDSESESVFVPQRQCS